MTRFNLEHIPSDCKQNEGTKLSDPEIQAMLSNPFFQLQEQKPAIALAKILHTSVENLCRMRVLEGGDLQNIAVCLLRHLNVWSDGLELARTPHGGLMQMRNVRIGELDTGKTDKGGRKKDRNGTAIPCLRDFGLGIACAMIPGPMGRTWSYFRICNVDEVPHRDGKKVPYKPKIKTGSADRQKRTKSTPTSRQSSLAPNGAKVPTASEPQQEQMFQNFMAYETGAAVHSKGRRA
jgi:hypothetical protein